MTAGLSIQATSDLRSLPIGPWAGLGVLAAWAAAALLAGGLLLRSRDASRGQGGRAVGKVVGELAARGAGRRLSIMITVG